MTKGPLCPHCFGAGVIRTRDGAFRCRTCEAILHFDASGEIAGIEVSGTSADEVARVATELSSRRWQRNSGVLTGSLKEEEMIDPVLTMTAIGSGLSLVDKFVDLVRKLRSGQEKPHRVEARQESGALVIRRDGQVVEKVSVQQMHLGEFDAARFEALRQRVSSLGNQFNGLYAQLPNLSVDEQVRIKQRMDSMHTDLCKDFREMVDISEKVLGVALEDHYTLYSTCHDGLG